MKKKLCMVLAFFMILGLIPLNVTAKAQKPTLNVTAGNMVIGQTFKLVAYNYSGKKTFKSSNKSVCTVTNSGKVTAKGKGNCTITVKLGSGKTLKCKLTVWVKPTKDKVKFSELPYSGNGTIFFKYESENDMPISMELKIKFYKNGSIVGYDTTTQYSERADKWGIISFYFDGKYDDYKLEITKIGFPYCLIAGTNTKISNSGKGDDEIVFEISNKLNDAVTCKVVCFMYDKNGKLYHVDCTTVDTQKRGISEGSIEYTYDSDYEPIKPAKYELFIVDMWE